MNPLLLSLRGNGDAQKLMPETTRALPENIMHLYMLQTLEITTGQKESLRFRCPVRSCNTADADQWEAIIIETPMIPAQVDAKPPHVKIIK